MPPKTAPFSRENLYNRSTTRKPVICQFVENSLLVSALFAVPYKAHGFNGQSASLTEVCHKKDVWQQGFYYLTLSFIGVRSARH
jgi:hypothetical protein